MLKQFLIFIAVLGVFFFYLSDILEWGVNKGLTEKKPGWTTTCARTMMILGDYKKAVDAYEQLIKDFPDNQGENANANAEASDAATPTVDGPKIYSRIGHCYENLGKKNDSHAGENYLKARRAYETFMKKYPDHPWFDQIKYSNENLNAVLPAGSH
jgi:tetratricopeptide (TPR) repeat protein